MAGIRSMMGVCAQRNIMTAEMTCQDHLRLFAELRGVEPPAVDSTVSRCPNCGCVLVILFGTW